MEKKSKIIIRQCDCGCCMLVIEKDIWEDGDVDYNISMQDSRYDNGQGGFFGRLKGALKLLFGKPVYYNDLYIDGEEGYRKLLQEMEELKDFPGE